MAINPTWLNFDTPRAVFASASQEAARRAATELAQRQQQIDQQEFAQTMAQRAALASLEQQGRAQQIALQQQNLAQEMAQALISNELQRDAMALRYKADLADNVLKQNQLALTERGVRVDEANSKRLAEDAAWGRSLEQQDLLNIGKRIPVQGGGEIIIEGPGKRKFIPAETKEDKLKQEKLQAEIDKLKRDTPKSITNPLAKVQYEAALKELESNKDYKKRTMPEKFEMIAELGRKFLPAQQASQSGSPAIQPGTVMKGYEFLGGDPSNPNSWKKVQ